MDENILGIVCKNIIISFRSRFINCLSKSLSEFRMRNLRRINDAADLCELKWTKYLISVESAGMENLLVILDEEDIDIAISDHKMLCQGTYHLLYEVV